MHDHPSPDTFSPADAQPLERIAHAWVIRLTSGDVQPEDVAAARAWCDADPAHKQAFVEARRLWQLTGQLEAARAQPTRRHYGPLAAAAVVVLGLSVLLVRHNAWDADYRTARGEQQRIVLSDGSKVLLDSGSAVDVSYGPAGRQLTLRKGQALFEVTPDPQRPFRVRAGDLSATALGTTYAVSRSDSGAQVTVAHGRVEVAAANAKAVLGAGESIRQARHGLQPQYTVNADKRLAWQHGRLVFDMTPLSEVLEQLEHYRPGFIRADDAQVAALKVSGTFQLDRLDDGIQTLSQAFGLQIERYTDYWIVLKAGR